MAALIDHVPQPIQDAFATRTTLKAPELCKLLGFDDKTLRQHVRAGNIRYVLKGLGAVRPRREFMMNDVLEFLANQGRRECPSTSPKTQRSTSSTSNGEVFDFMARRAKQKSGKPGA
jgi:hypothetical protein